MSYYETYEFFALDRCRTAAQRRAVRRISTRAAIDPDEAGDLSPLYLLWVLSVQYGDRPATATEPPRPPGLHRRDGALHLFAECLGLNANLLRTALEAPPAVRRNVGQLLDAAGARPAPSRRGGRTSNTGT